MSIIVMVILHVLIFTGEAVSDFSLRHSFQTVHFCFKALLFQQLLITACIYVVTDSSAIQPLLL
jgi:hypothetical protein